MKQLTTEEKSSFIATNWFTMKTQDIADKIGMAERTVRTWARKMNLPSKAGTDTRTLTPIDAITIDREKERSKGNKVTDEKKYKVALSLIDELQKERTVIYETKDVFDDYTYVYKPLTKDTESVAVVLASDWHVEEEVKEQWTNGLNKYNLKVAENCAEQFFQNTVKLLEKEGNATKIDTLVLALLGDFITNYLHDENVETCQLGPSEAVLFAQSLLSAGIEYLLKNTKVRVKSRFVLVKTDKSI